jgi:hypothetical protein
MADQLEKIIMEAHTVGLRCTGVFLGKVSNLWQINFRTEEGEYHYGQGSGPLLAAKRAIAAYKKQMPAPQPKSIDDFL